MKCQQGWTLVLLAVMVGIGFGVGWSTTTGLAAQSSAKDDSTTTPHAPPAFKAEDPAQRGLDANLYVQTAAEYRACCYQAYNLATLRLQQGTDKAKGKEDRLAVVMDLDETVLDNAGFQAMQLRSGLAFDQRLWDVWEEKHGALVGLVPGAKEFILEAGKRGVTVFYIGNRNDKSRDQTKAILKRLGIPLTGDQCLKLKTETSDKTKRRQEVEKEYTVLLYVGDNLCDFDEKYRFKKFDKKSPEGREAAIKARNDQTDADRAAWGEKWIILPNPVYGEWQKPLGSGKDDLDRLVPVEKTP